MLFKQLLIHTQHVEYVNKHIINEHQTHTTMHFNENLLHEIKFICPLQHCLGTKIKFYKLFKRETSKSYSFLKKQINK